MNFVCVEEGTSMTRVRCPSPVLVRQAVDELERQIADLIARLAATTAEKLRFKAERDTLADVVGRQNAELQLYREQHHSQPHPNPVSSICVTLKTGQVAVRTSLTCLRMYWMLSELSLQEQCKCELDIARRWGRHEPPMSMSNAGSNGIGAQYRHEAGLLPEPAASAPPS